MKKTLFIYMILNVFLSIGLQAQDQRNLDVKVADMLALMPTNDLKQRDKIMEQAISYGGAFIAKVADMTVAPGTGDDTAARFVLNSLARYASGLQRNDACVLIEKEYIKALDEKSDKELKAFFISQLSLIGHVATVNKMSEYMTDERLCEPATQALLSIGSKNAEEVIFEALPSSKGKNKVTIVKALGEINSEKANSSIIKLEGSADNNLQKVVLNSLASIGAPSSYHTLLQAAQKVKYEYEATNAAAAFLKYAQQLSLNNHSKECKRACLEIIKTNKKAHLLHNRLAAITIYSQFDSKKALSMTMSEVNNNDKAYRDGILVLATKLSTQQNAKKWIKIAESATPETKADIIDMLGSKKSTIAIPFIKNSLSSSSSEVRMASLTALGKIQKDKAVPVLVKHISSGKDIEYATSVILYLVGKDQLAPIASALDKTSGNSKAALINILAAKSADQYCEKYFTLINADDKTIRTAALNALVKTVKADDLNRLINILNKTDKSNISLAQQAVFNAVAASGMSKQSINKVLKALDISLQKDRFIAILPRLDNNEAFDKTLELFTNEQGDIKKEAFEALTNWNGTKASKILFDICNQKSSTYRSKAFKAYVDQIKQAKITSDQKLLGLRKIMNIANDKEEKTIVIKALKTINTYPAFKFTCQFLDEKDLQADVSDAIMNIALPSKNQKIGLFGDDVRETLEKIISLLTGQDSDYSKINIRNYINSMPKESGFVSMFNGVDLSGWKGLVGNPISRAKMSTKTLALKQKKANKQMMDHWRVQDGSIMFSGKGANLCSNKVYGDFELIVDWRITKHGDSGIYLRGTPQVQVWDTSRVDVDAQVGSGGLYNNQVNTSKPLKVADNAIGEWNTFRITMIGDKVTVYLNGELVVDNVTMENYWDRSLPIFATGNIELQAHGTNLAFRDIYIRNIRDSGYTLSREETNAGFTPLFNGKDLDNWIGNKTDYHVEDGNIVIRPDNGGDGNLFSEKEYSDFHFKFEFKLTPGANNGLGIRAPLEGDAAYLGMELQILDNTSPIFANLQEYQYHGSVYGTIAAKRGFLKPVGEWNKEEVIAKGSKVKVILNGETIVDGDIKEASKNGTADHKNHPGLKREKGHIGFLGHGSLVWFRNIRINEL